MNKQLAPTFRTKAPKNSPIYWMGHKGRQLDDMHRALPKGFDAFYETFTGSASLSLSLLNAGSITGHDVYLNDLNEPLMNFWQVLRDNPDALINALLDLHEEHWAGNKVLYDQACLDKCDMTLPPLDRAVAFYVQNVLTAGTAMLNDMNFCHPLNSGKGLHEEWILELKRFSKLLQGVNLSSGDFRKQKLTNGNILYFNDPPYLIGKDKEKRYYAVDFDHKGFAKHCHAQRKHGHVMITYDMNPIHIKRFRTWNIYSHWVYYVSGGYWDRELIITSYKIPFADLWVDEAGWKIIKEGGVFYPRGKKPCAEIPETKPAPLASNDNTPPLPDKKYEIIYADPPWAYYGSQNKMGAAGNHYNTMSIDELKALDIKSIVADKSVCFMWATSSTLPHVADVMKSWGFNFNNVAWVWAKTRKDGQLMGAAGTRPTYVKPNNIEYLCVGSTQKRGLSPWKGVSDAGANMVQLVQEPRLAHSQKPERFRELIMELTGDRSRIELFARRAADENWDVWGNQAVSP